MEDKERAISRTLPMGTVLLSQYEIVSVLGEGGFAITYMGKNRDGRTVAVKEYFPSSFAVRETSMLHVFSETKELFDKGKRRFIKEAEVLRQFQHLDGIAAIYDCFEENDTAYIVMEYIEGITLKDYVVGQGVLTYNELVSLMSPVMRALIQVHRHGVIHRDISPDNIIIGLDNKARLIDFGAAGIVSGDFGKTVILKTGYAPPEQYIEGGKLGAWTDVYGLCATLYMGITGRPPLDTVERLQRGEKQTEEELYAALTGGSNEQSVNNSKEFPESAGLLTWQAEAILTGLALAADERYSNMEELYEALTVAPSIENDVTVTGHMIAERDEKLIRSHAKAKERKNILPLILAGVSLTLVLILSVIVGMMIVRQKEHNDNMQGENIQDTWESSVTSGAAEDAQERKGDNVREDASVDTQAGENDSVKMTTTENTSVKQTDATTSQQRAEDIDTAKTEAAADTHNSTEATTQRQTTVNKKTEKSTTESIKIHEEDSVEHLDIE